MLELPCKHKAIHTEQVKWKSVTVMFNLKHKTAFVKNKITKNLEMCQAWAIFHHSVVKQE